MSDIPADLAPDRVCAALRTRMLGRSLEIKAATGSTMDDARLVATHRPEGFVTVADHQAEGRGSHGRIWESPAGTDLYFSVLLRPPVALASLGALTLAMGVGVAEAADALLGRSVARVKWPNDVWLSGGAKCAGILVESRASGAIADFVVVGVGLNVNRRSFPEGLAAGATSLSIESGMPFDRAEVLAEILASLERWYDRFVERGAAPIVQAVEARLAMRGRRVRCGGVEGRLEGLSPEGGLRIADDRGERVVMAGRLELIGPPTGASPSQ